MFEVFFFLRDGFILKKTSLKTIWFHEKYVWRNGETINKTLENKSKAFKKQKIQIKEQKLVSVPSAVSKRSCQFSGDTRNFKTVNVT